MLSAFLSEVESVAAGCDDACIGKQLKSIVERLDPQLIADNPTRKSGRELAKLFYVKHIDHKNVYTAAPRMTALFRRIIPNVRTRSSFMSGVLRSIRERSSAGAGADGPGGPGADLYAIHKEHYWLNLTQQESSELRAHADDVSREKQRSLMQVSASDVEQMIYRCRGSGNIFERCVGLLLASGVRETELLSTSEFEIPTDEEYQKIEQLMSPRFDATVPDAIVQVGSAKTRDDPLSLGLMAVFGVEERTVMGLKYDEQVALEERLMAQRARISGPEGPAGPRGPKEAQRARCVKPLLIYTAPEFIAGVKAIRDYLQKRSERRFRLWPRARITALYGHDMKEAIDELFPEFAATPNFTPHKMRAIYANVAHFLYGRGIGQTEFFRTVLCHETSGSVQAYEVIEVKN